MRPRPGRQNQVERSTDRQLECKNEPAAKDPFDLADRVIMIQYNENDGDLSFEYISAMGFAYLDFVIRVEVSPCLEDIEETTVVLVDQHTGEDVATVDYHTQLEMSALWSDVCTAQDAAIERARADRWS